MNVSLVFNSYFQDYIDFGEIWVDVSTNGGTSGPPNSRKPWT